VLYTIVRTLQNLLVPILHKITESYQFHIFLNYLLGVVWNHFLFARYFTMLYLECIALNERMIWCEIIWKEVVLTNHGNILAFSLKDWGKSRKSSVRIDEVPAEIWTEHVQDKSAQRCHYINLLCVKWINKYTDCLASTYLNTFLRKLAVIFKTFLGNASVL
jgi:hypothetical protein